MAEIVFASGSFDILHIGHLNFLEHAWKLGGEDGRLIVGVQEDRWMRDIKHHEPYMSQQDRLRIVQSLAMVDEAFLVYGPEYPDILLRHGVTIRAIGEDRRLVWSESDNIKARMEAAGIRYVHLPYTTGISSTIYKDKMQAQSYDYFIISSSSLTDIAMAEAERLEEEGLRCFYPARDIADNLSPQDYKIAIYNAVRNSYQAKVFWDEVSHGPLVDLGICLGAGVSVDEFRTITVGKADLYIKELAE